MEKPISVITPAGNGTRHARTSAMANALHEFLSRDHERLDALLNACLQELDAQAYDEFRRGLLRHISIEERVLFPDLRKRRGASELEVQLHRDHAVLAALLVVPPSEVELRQIASILEVHNELEESGGGLYELVESAAGDELESLMERVHAIPQVRVVPNAESAIARTSIAQLLREAEEGRRRFLASRDGV